MAKKRTNGGNGAPKAKKEFLGVAGATQQHAIKLAKGQGTGLRPDQERALGTAIDANNLREELRHS